MDSVGLVHKGLVIYRWAYIQIELAAVWSYSRRTTEYTDPAVPRG